MADIDAIISTWPASTVDIDRLEAAVSLYRGDFLDDFYLADGSAFAEWMLAQRARLREAILQVLYRLVEYHGALGGYDSAIIFARRLLEIEPWHEEAHRELICLFTLDSQRSAALVQCDSCRQILSEELGVKPAAATDLVRNDPSTGHTHGL